MKKASTLTTIAIFGILAACEIMPRNTLKDCRLQCDDSEKSRACLEFCNCIHLDGNPLDSCLDKYDKAAPDSLPLR